MNREVFQFGYEVYESSADLSESDLSLLQLAQQAAESAYAPYSKFQVGAAARMSNNEIISGSNQENVSFPAGLCAEGVLLAVASSKFPGLPIDTLAISYRSSLVESDHPIAPCGICRQSIQEFRERTGNPVRLIMGGMLGKVIVVSDASSLLPFAFKF